MSAQKQARREQMDPKSNKKVQSEMSQAGAPPGKPMQNGPSMGGHGGQPEAAPGQPQAQIPAPAPGGQAQPGPMSQPMGQPAQGDPNAAQQQQGPAPGYGGRPGINVQQGNPMNGMDLNSAPPLTYSPFGDINPPGDPRMGGNVTVRPFSGMPTTWTAGQKLNKTPYGSTQQPPSQMMSQLESVRQAKETWERDPNLNIMTMNRDGTTEIPSGMGIIGKPLELNSPIIGNLLQVGPDQQGPRQLGLAGMQNAETAVELPSRERGPGLNTGFTGQIA